jgi:hypothetical protein
MGLPRHLGASESGSGHGPFGQKAFKAALIGCAALLVVGLVLLLFAGGALRDVGASFLALGILGLTTAGGGLLLERVLQRTPPPSPEVTSGNGRGRHPPPPSRVERLRRP